MNQQFDRSTWDRRAVYVSLLALVVSMSAVTFTFLQWRTANEALQDSRSSRIANFAIVTDIFYLDANSVKHYFDTKKPISIGDLDQKTIWIALTIINNGPGPGAIRGVALVRRPSEGEFWNSSLPDQKYDCDGKRRVNDAQCAGIWPISFERTESYVLYIPLGSVFGKLKDGDDGGLIVKMNAIGARAQFVLISSGIRLA